MSTNVKQNGPPAFSLAKKNGQGSGIFSGAPLMPFSLGQPFPQAEQPALFSSGPPKKPLAFAKGGIFGKNATNGKTKPALFLIEPPKKPFSFGQPFPQAEGNEQPALFSSGPPKKPVGPMEPFAFAKGGIFGKNATGGKTKRRQRRRGTRRSKTNRKNNRR
jgi:hypothetical protein